MLWSGGFSRDSPKECFAASSHSIYILSLLGELKLLDKVLFMKDIYCSATAMLSLKK